nr:phospholipase-like protein [Tanacetum cinerariifolium]
MNMIAENLSICVSEREMLIGELDRCPCTMAYDSAKLLREMNDPDFAKIREFCLIMSFRFGAVSFSNYSKGDMKFKERVFPHRVGLSITSLDLVCVIEDKEYFSQLCDEYAIRVCLLLCLEVIFMGKLMVKEVDDTLMRLVESLEAWNAFPWGEHICMQLYDEIMNVVDNHKSEHLEGLHKSRKYVPTYTLGGFVWSFKVCILESFEMGNHWWNKLSEAIPREDFILEKEFMRRLLEEERLLLEEERLFKEKKRVRLEDQRRLKLKQECELQVKKRWGEDYRKRSYTFINSDHMKQAMPRCAPKKRSGSVGRSTIFRSAKIWTYILVNPANFDHIDLWVDYMWHVRPHNASWAMVSSYLVQLLLQNSKPLWYVNGEMYPIAWTEADKSGVVTLYDSGGLYDLELKDWYIETRDYLKLLNVFDKKGIEKSTYHVTFKIAERVPKQGVSLVTVGFGCWDKSLLDVVGIIVAQVYVNIALIKWDTMSMDDLYNNLKVYELEVTWMYSSSSSTQNMAFVSCLNNNTSNTNGVVNTAQAVNTAHGVSTTSTQVNDAYFTNIDNLNDMEEMDLRWKMAMLTMRARRVIRQRKGLIMHAWLSHLQVLTQSSTPYTGNFMPPTPDLSFTGLDEFVNKHIVENCKAKSSKEEPKFWSTAMAKTINGKAHLHAEVDGKKIIVTESPVRRDLRLADEEGIDCLPDSTIFEQGALMGKPIRKDTQVPQPSGPTEYVADEVVHKELGDSLVRVATTASSLEEEQDNGGSLRCQETIWDTIAQNRFESIYKHFNDSLLTRGNTLRSNEDSLKLDELMTLCTTLQNKVLDLKKTTTTQRNEIASLKRRVKKLEKKNKSRTHRLKRLYKVGLTARVESFGNEESLGEDASKQERRINAIDVFVAWKDENVVEDVVDVAQVSTTATTVTITTEEITLAQALEALKTSKPKVKWIVFQEPAKIDVDHRLDEKLQAQEQEELFDAEKATLFLQLLEKKRKHFVAKRAEEKRNKPPTKAHQRKITRTYLKNMEGYKLKYLKLKEFDSIQEMFDIAFKMVNTFEYFRTELVKGKEKRAGEELAQKITKKQKVEDDKEKAELKQLMETILDEKK